jgi:hypothetical protein
MQDSKSVTSYRQWLSVLGQQDVYLNRHDQSGEVEQNLQEPVEALQRLEKDIGSRLLSLMVEFASTKFTFFNSLWDSNEK